MRLAILSDIHGNLPALEAVVDDLRYRRADRVINLGDHVSGPLLPEETVRFLMLQDWVHLAGNHERQLLTLPLSEQGPSDAFAHGRLTGEQLSWLATLNHSQTHGEDLWLCHGTPDSDSTYLLETVEKTGVRRAGGDEIHRRLGQVEAPVVACGHSHIPRWVCLGGGRRVVNPGSVGLPAYDDTHPSPHVMASGSPEARYAILEQRPDGWCCELIAVPYDYEPMARLADRRGRPDWAMALRTGQIYGPLGSAKK